MSTSDSDRAGPGKRRRSRRNGSRRGRHVAIGATDAYLTPTESRLLDVLRSRIGVVSTRAELTALAMPGTVVLDRTIDVHIKSLRRKLAGGPEWIETVYGVGYRLVRRESS